MVKVPAETPAARPGAEYPLYEGSGPSPAARQPYVAVPCPVCHTRMHATEDQVGQEMVCPDCGTPVVVSRPAEAEGKKSRPAVQVEEYRLCEEVDVASPGSRPADQTYIPVTCPLCNTLMHATEDQVGRKMVCPDCETAVAVHPLAETDAKKGPAGVVAPTDEEYPLCEGVDQPPPDSAAYQLYVAVACPVCHTRLHATEGQVGQEMVCPDCETPVVVPPPPAAKRKPDPPAGAGGEYGVGESIEVPEFEPFIARPRWRPGFDVAGAPEGAEGPDLSGAPPGRPFISGVFTFPLYPGVWVRWLALSAWATIMLFLAAGAFWLGTSAVASLWAVAFWIGSLMFTITVCILGIMWAALVCSCCLAILRDTAAGNDRIENWPGWLFLDWIGEPLYVINSFVLSVLPGLGVGRILDSAGWASWFSVPASLLVVFPIVLLSMLERDSPLNPLSLPVWRSMLPVWRAWGLFYIETIVLVAMVGVLAAMVGWFAMQLLDLAKSLSIPVVAALCVAMLMIYFRLLGRLAWCCSGRSARMASRVYPRTNGAETSPAAR